MAERSEWDEKSTALRPRLDPSESPEDAFSLTVAEGPDQGRAFVLDASRPSRLLVGVSPSCDVKLTDPQVSRRHAALELAGRRVRITDLDSTNGTFVDGVAVVEAFLSGGEVVRLGGTAFRVERGAPTPAASLPMATHFGRVMGASTEMRRLYPLCARLAAANVSVVIEGETGTGKEVLAEALHEEGPRAAGPFVVFDCTAVPPNLVESELFGHERGAFTGAVSRRAGVFEQAHGGTLLIDEIGDLDPALQPKLLRALERGEIRRVGGGKPIKVEVRVLSATRRDLDHEVAAGRFRDDLFHRLAVARIELPPLRRRRGDVAVLVQHFWARMGGDDAGPPHDVLRRWSEDPWPGNVRELRNSVARLIALGTLADGPSTFDDDEQPMSQQSRDIVEDVLRMSLPLTQARQRVVDHFERRYIERVLGQHDGNVVRAAAASGVARRYFQILRAKQGRGPAGD